MGWSMHNRRNKLTLQERCFTRLFRTWPWFPFTEIWNFQKQTYSSPKKFFSPQVRKQKQEKCLNEIQAISQNVTTKYYKTKCSGTKYQKTKYRTHKILEIKYHKKKNHNCKWESRCLASRVDSHGQSWRSWYDMVWSWWFILAMVWSWQDHGMVIMDVPWSWYFCHGMAVMEWCKIREQWSEKFSDVPLLIHLFLFSKKWVALMTRVALRTLFGTTYPETAC